MKAGAFCFRSLLMMASLATVLNANGQASLHPQFSVTETVVAEVTPRYAEAGFWRKLLMGSNYRQTWSTPVELPVFRLSATPFTIKRLGGSKQTYSLYLVDHNDQEWVLRSVDKNVKKGVPRLLQFTPFVAYKQELISAAHPYGAAVLAPLVKAAGITGPEPVYFWVADDSSFGEHRHLFANTVMMLEKVDLAPGGGEVYDTDTVLQVLEENPNAAIAAREFLKARIIDMVTGDWDRHDGNWLWWSKKSGDKLMFYPIPRDRDHALFYVGGILPAIAKRTLEPHLRGLTASPDKLARFNKKAAALDRRLLKSLSLEDWLQTTREMQAILNDAVIDQAIAAIPSSISAGEKQEIKSKMKSRRDQLPEHIRHYYLRLFR